MQATHVRHVT